MEADAMLLALGQDLEAANLREAVLRALGEDHPGLGTAEDAVEAIAARIAGLRATTPSGWRVKASAACYGSARPATGDNLRGDVAASLVRDLLAV